ncbi:MAG: GGDEF domain-containing protein [Deltaproteobacteria bacterium]|jgi:diguanylate cyclase (GGDEF)-like protein|nr:GGDEF domain-containing protein [Deltaproteobacteria bacterium]
MNNQGGFRRSISIPAVVAFFVSVLLCCVVLYCAWQFRLAPVREWYQFPELWVALGFGLFISCLVGLVMQDNYALKLAQIKLEEKAKSDYLTGIANRRHFMDMAPVHLQHAARNNKSCFIIMFDVDNFKKTNDTYGHAAGDMVLGVTAARVKSIIRPYDLFARYGGEEFIMLAVDVEQKEAEALVSRIRLSLCDAPFFFGDMSISVSASFGLAQVLPGADFETVIRWADEALYTAKNEGRNKSVCYVAK